MRGYGTPVCPASGKWVMENKNSELTKNVTKVAHDLLIKFSNEMDIDPSTVIYDILYFRWIYLLFLNGRILLIRLYLMDLICQKIFNQIH